MVDTYGSAPEEVRGFVVGGWRDCGNQEGSLLFQLLEGDSIFFLHLVHPGDLSDKGPFFRISHAHFSEDVLPRLSAHDCVIFLGSSLAGCDGSGLLGNVTERYREFLYLVMPLPHHACVSVIYFEFNPNPS